MGDLGLERAYVVNLASDPVHIRPHVWMGRLEALLDRLGILPTPGAAVSPARPQRR